MSNLRNLRDDAWLVLVPLYQSNLDCDYCFLKKINRHLPNTYNINISTVKNTLNNSNKICKITLSGGGEPFKLF